jgi:hypothetical protein
MSTHGSVFMSSVMALACCAFPLSTPRPSAGE